MCDFSSEYHRFLGECEAVLAIPGAHAETSLYGAYEQLLGWQSNELRGASSRVTQTVGLGNLTPDFVATDNAAAYGWVEVKAAGKQLGSLTGRDKRQIQIYKEHLSWWILTNGWHWILYEGAVPVAEVMFDRGVLAVGRRRQTPRATEIGKLDRLLSTFFAHQLPPFSNPASAIERLAVGASALKIACEEALSANPPQALIDVVEEFQGLVFQAGVRFGEAEFADTYAQTAAFGLLLAKSSTSGQITAASAPSFINATAHPFLWRTLEILFDRSVREPLAWAIEELLTTVNRIPQHLFAHTARRDPLLYAYEWFFSKYDPSERRRRGVYYTRRGRAISGDRRSETTSDPLRFDWTNGFASSILGPRYRHRDVPPWIG